MLYQNAQQRLNERCSVSFSLYRTLVSIIYIGRNRKKSEVAVVANAGLCSPGPDFSKIEPYKQVITRCRKPLASKETYKAVASPRWCNVRFVACESSCTKGTRFARQTELKPFLTLSFSFSSVLRLLTRNERAHFSRIMTSRSTDF